MRDGVAGAVEPNNKNHGRIELKCSPLWSVPKNEIRLTLTTLNKRILNFDHATNSNISFIVNFLMTILLRLKPIIEDYGVDVT